MSESTSSTTHEHRGLIVAVVGVGVALLTVLVTLHLGLRDDIADLRGEVRAVDGRVQALGERVARIESHVDGIDRRVARIEGRLDAVLPAITLAAPEPPSSE